MAAEAAAGRLLISSILLLLSNISSCLPSDALLNAAQALSNSGYLSMSLTLQLVSSSLTPHTPSLTIFAASDAAFAENGQPSLSLLQFHLSPLSFPLYLLKSLPKSTKIPTLFANHSLTFNNDLNDEVLLNGVKLSRTPIYDDGRLVIFGIDQFFDPDFDDCDDGCNRTATSGNNLRCSINEGGGGIASNYSFGGATGAMRSNGYSVIASFLDLQLVENFQEGVLMTIFAPVDEVMKGFIGDLSEYSSIFFRHVVPCKIMWDDLVNLEEDDVEKMVLQTFLDGFGISVSRSGDILMLNEVPVTFPDMFHNDWLVVHGLRGMLEAADQVERAHGYEVESTKISEESFLELDDDDGGEF